MARLSIPGAEYRKREVMHSQLLVLSPESRDKLQSRLKSIAETLEDGQHLCTRVYDSYRQDKEDNYTTPRTVVQIIHRCLGETEEDRVNRSYALQLPPSRRLAARRSMLKLLIRQLT